MGIGKQTRAAVGLAVLVCVIGACAASHTAPPPPPSMGGLSGAWLLETDGSPIRIVRAPEDTVSVTVSREPLILRQGAAVSDSSITLDIAGVVVAGARSVTNGIQRTAEAELVTGGTQAGRLTFFAPMLVFRGEWSGDAFTGTFEVDRKQAGKDVVVLDAPCEWRMRRIGGS